MKTTATTEAISSPPEEKGYWSTKMASKHLLRQRQTEGGPKNRLANPGSRQKIAKATHAGRGHETIWEMSDKVDTIRDLLRNCQRA
jgi:hypothetical protein